MRRLEAPVHDKPGIDQHQRRALHQDVREIGSDIKKLQRRRAVTRYEAPFEAAAIGSCQLPRILMTTDNPLDNPVMRNSLS